MEITTRQRRIAIWRDVIWLRTLGKPKNVPCRQNSFPCRRSSSRSEG